MEGVELDMKSKEGDPIVEGVNAKVCSKCGELKLYTDFALAARNKSGIGAACKSCVREHSRQYRAKNPEKRRQSWREYQFKKRYGMTEQEVRNLKRLQGSFCPACQSEVDPETLVYDHCHTTGNYRGIICSKCNTGIGKCGDNLEGLLKRAVYLSSAKGGLDHPGAREAITDYLRQIIFNVGCLGLPGHLDSPLALEPKLFQVPEVGEEHGAA